MNSRDLELVKRKYPVSADVIALSLDGKGVCPAQPERLERRALDRFVPGEAPGGSGLAQCVPGPVGITFKVFAVRPLDWDNYRLKDLQDLLIEAGCLSDDNHQEVPKGIVETHQVHTKAEERTEILIEKIVEKKC